jgi:hypothetical protein
MPWKTTKDRMERDRAEGKSDGTQAGELVREQMSKLKRGQGRPRSRKQAVAIGLSEARRAGKKIPPRKPSPSRSRSRSKSASRSRSR